LFGGRCGFGGQALILLSFGFELSPKAGGGAGAFVVLGFLGVFGFLVGCDEVAVGLVEDGLADFAEGAFGDGVELVGVGAGDLEAVEEHGGVFGIDAAFGQGGDDQGECDLDGVTVLEGWEMELEGWVAGLGEERVALGAVLQGHWVKDGGDRVAQLVAAEAAMAALELDVVVAEDLVDERERTAALSVDADVATEFGRHIVLWVEGTLWGYPPPPSLGFLAANYSKDRGYGSKYGRD
jgi:hypothetical protein